MKGGSSESGRRKTPHAAATFGVLTGLVGSRPPEFPGILKYNRESLEAPSKPVRRPWEPDVRSKAS